MGMWDKDKVFPPDGRLDELYEPGPTDEPRGSQFVLWEVTPDVGTIQTDVGEATMTHLVVSDELTPDERKKVGTLSTAIGEKAREAEDGDLPAVVQLRRVSTDKGNDALVLQFIREFDAPKSTKSGRSKKEGSEDVPF